MSIMGGTSVMNTKKILLVEDNPDDEELTILAFEKNNLKNPMVVVRDGAEALEFMFGQGRFAGRDVNDLPQIVILDLKLPKIDGLTVLKRIREDERTRSTPVVILTSSKEDKDMVEAYKLGTNAYVRKPVDFLEFTQAVTQLGLFWLILNEVPPSSC